MGQMSRKVVSNIQIICTKLAINSLVYTSFRRKLNCLQLYLNLEHWERRFCDTTENIKENINRLRSLWGDAYGEIGMYANTLRSLVNKTLLAHSLRTTRRFCVAWFWWGTSIGIPTNKCGMRVRNLTCRCLHFKLIDLLKLHL